LKSVSSETNFVHSVCSVYSVYPVKLKI
jgi:hypothetical protein